MIFMVIGDDFDLKFKPLLEIGVGHIASVLEPADTGRNIWQSTVLPDGRTVPTVGGQTWDSQTFIETL